MDACFKRSRLGAVLMIVCPLVASGFGLAVFLPMALASLLCGVICLVGGALSRRIVVAQLSQALVQDLVSADAERRKLVLAELREPERKWFLAEIARIAARSECRRSAARKT